jgi:hypothetical protein
MEELALLPDDDATDRERAQYGLRVADLKLLWPPGLALRGTPTFRPNDAHRIPPLPYGVAVLDGGAVPICLIIAILNSPAHHPRADK